MPRRRTSLAKFRRWPFADAYAKFQHGEIGVATFKRISGNCVGTRLKYLSRDTEEIVYHQRNINARVTAFAWSHPYQNCFAYGTKIGEVIVKTGRNVNGTLAEDGFPRTTFKISRGGVAGISFDPVVRSAVSVLSTDGSVSHWDILKGTHGLLLDPELETDEYGSIAASECHPGMIAVGGDSGILTLLDHRSGARPITKRKIHEGLVKSVEFSKGSPADLLATASSDKTAKVWDVRMLKQGSSPAEAIAVFSHERPVVSARFSNTNANRLLITDKLSYFKTFLISNSTEIAYIAPYEQSLYFMGLPGIATWHPLTDLVVTGRFASQRSTIFQLKLFDTFSNPEGPEKTMIEFSLHTICDRNSPKIQVNEFSLDGEALASVSENYIFFLHTKTVK